MARKRGRQNTVDPCRNGARQSIAFHAAAQGEKKTAASG